MNSAPRESGNDVYNITFAYFINVTYILLGYNKHKNFMNSETNQSKVSTNFNLFKQLNL